MSLTLFCFHLTTV